MALRGTGPVYHRAYFSITRKTTSEKDRICAQAASSISLIRNSAPPSPVYDSATSYGWAAGVQKGKKTSQKDRICAHAARSAASHGRASQVKCLTPGLQGLKKTGKRPPTAEL